MVKPTANTEMSLTFIRIIEIIMCMQCLIAHVHSLKDEEPMPHIVLFCGTYGGFFILSLVTLILPLSGQISPPGVDLVFCFLGFILFYAAACFAMFFVQIDNHLIAIDGKASEVDENAHPFFQQCTYHAILSILTGTLYLMHAVISADRLTSMLKGLEEDVEREINEDDIDIDPGEPISLHLFFLNWLIQIWNTKCCLKIRKKGRLCKMCCIAYLRKKRTPKPEERYARRRDKMVEINERMHGVTVTDVTPHEFIRNPRRTVMQIARRESMKRSQIFMLENENQDEEEASTSEANLQRREVTFMRNSLFDSGSSLLDNVILWREERAFVGDCDEDHLENAEAAKSVSFIRNTKFARNTNVDGSPFKRTESIDSMPSLPSATGSSENVVKKKGPSFTRNKAFGSDSISTFKRFFNLFPRSVEIVEQKVDKNMVDTTSDIEASSMYLGNSVSQIRIPDNNEKADKVKPILKSTTNFADDKPSSMTLAPRVSRVRISDDEKVEPILKSTTNIKKEVSKTEVRKTPSILKTTLKKDLEITSKNKNVEPKDINKVNEVPKTKEPSNEDINLPGSNLIPSILTNTLNKDLEIILKDEEEVPKTKASSNEDINLPASNLIPSILANKLNKDLEITLKDENVEAEQKEVEIDYPVREAAKYIPVLKISQINPEDIVENTEYKKVEIDYPVTEIATHIPVLKISQINAEENAENTEHKKVEIDYPATEIATHIPVLKISQINAENTEHKKVEIDYPVAKLANYISISTMSQINAEDKTENPEHFADNSRKDSTDNISELIIEEVEYDSDIQQVTHENASKTVFDSTSYMKKVSSLIPTENQTSTSFPKFNSTSYIQTISELIPDEKSTTSRKKNNEK